MIVFGNFNLPLQSQSRRSMYIAKLCKKKNIARF